MESRFTPLLSTNYIPSKDELEEIYELLVDPVKQVNKLDAKIARLQNIIDQLSLKRSQLHTDIVRHRNLTAPLRRIPEELLQDIFIQCLPVDHNAVMSCHEAPLLLGRVCSQWRSVSIATPRLWSSIHIVVTADAPSWPSNDEGLTDDQNTYIEAVDVWLSRSGELPLSISFFHPPYVYPYPEYRKLVLATLLRFSPRWRNISLFVSSESSTVLSSLSREVVPLLERLTFHDFAHIPSPQSDILPFDIFRAPRLHTVSSSYFDLIPEDMYWSRLTSLSLESLGEGTDQLAPSRVLEVLRKSPNLTHCRLEFGWSAMFPSGGHEIVTMPLLEAFSITEGVVPLHSFFRFLQLPALINLEFSTSPAGYRHDLEASEEPEEPSICVLLPRLGLLRELTLSTANMTHATVIKCLQYTPSITRLSILSQPHHKFLSGGWPSPRNPWNPFKDEVATFLTPINGQPPACPCLKVLECNPGGMSDAILLTFIQQRTSHASFHDVQQLERVDIIFHRPKQMDILAVLPPDVLAATRITLDYDTPPSPRRNLTPWVGLEEPGRLEISAKTSRYHYN